jgi:hypothetical protein
MRRAVCDRENLGPGEREGEKVRFEPFVGIAPRRYTDAFAMPARENLDGSILRFVRSEASPRLAITSAYLEAEEVEIRSLYESLDRAGLSPRVGGRSSGKQRRG